ncbi:MAG: hypothetical protein HON90_02000 [Halobacteriovoraceae bacterium]|jgi:hypothetical protein|nr:hypothetical protein [Halobacteriovoraceae bacterium]
MRQFIFITITILMSSNSFAKNAFNTIEAIFNKSQNLSLDHWDGLRLECDRIDVNHIRKNVGSIEFSSILSSIHLISFHLYSDDSLYISEYDLELIPSAQGLVSLKSSTFDSSEYADQDTTTYKYYELTFKMYADKIIIQSALTRVERSICEMEEYRSCENTNEDIKPKQIKSYYVCEK